MSKTQNAVTGEGKASRANEFFSVPKSKSDLRKLWQGAEKLYGDEFPDWADEDDKKGNLRGLGFSSWAYVDAEKQDQYFEEMNAMENAGIIVEGDEGDGCVHHFYIRKP